MSAPKSHVANSSAQLAEIIRVLAGVSQRLHTVSGGAAVAAVAQAGVYHVGGARWASVSVLRPGQSRTLVATAAVAQQAEALQHELGQGPSVDTALEDNVYLSKEVARDRRWPEFGAQAGHRLGVGSLVTYRMPVLEQPETTVVFTLYSDGVDVFNGQALWAGSLVASQCAVAVAAQIHHQHLEQTLRSNREIGAAVGVLMTRHGLTYEQAFELLCSISQGSNRKLVGIAADVLRTGELPLPPTRPGARPQHTSGTSA